ncbi:MAG: hypothetical protein HY512_00345 [Candidatus Aenigmarchaeota archaeon]|nr:hypothetical protein [Candidatus Aenigmarchaeota archaeon]
MYGFNNSEISILKRLNTPPKIQDFLNKLKANFEPNGDTCRSPRLVLRNKEAHCVEGAILAAAAMRIHGHKPLVLDLTSNKKDFDHVVAVFRQFGCWGAVSKTNHPVLRYREPVYKSIRELVMSYFHEYTKDGEKTLRSYSIPVNLSRFDKLGWTTSEKDIWYIPEYLLEVPHKQILTHTQISNLRKADLLEIKAGDMLEWKTKL